MARESSAGGLVIREHEGELQLAVIRPHGKNVWALPKGHVDGVETAAQAAQREVLEETGVKADLLGEVGEISYFYQFRNEKINKRVVFFLFRYLSGEIGEIAPEMRVEVDEARWIPLSRSSVLLAYRGEREMAKKASAQIATFMPPPRLSPPAPDQ